MCRAESWCPAQAVLYALGAAEAHVGFHIPGPSLPVTGNSGGAQDFTTTQPYKQQKDYTSADQAALANIQAVIATLQGYGVPGLETVCPACCLGVSAPGPPVCSTHAVAAMLGGSQRAGTLAPESPDVHDLPRAADLGSCQAWLRPPALPAAV